MGIFGWEFRADNVTLRGMVTRWDISDALVGGDKDWLLFVRPYPEFEYLLHNRFGRRTTDINLRDGVIECEVEPPDWLRTVHGDIDARDRDTARSFLENLVGREVKVVGTWVDDKSHEDKTEIHPITSILVERPEPDPSRITIELYVFSDSSEEILPPHAHENMTATFSVPFPSVAGGVNLPIFEVTGELNMSRGVLLHIAHDGGQYRLESTVESGTASEGNGFYWNKVRLRTVSMPTPGLMTAYRSKIKLVHMASGKSLHSHDRAYGHPGTSGQQQVTAFEFADDNDFWVVKGPYGQPESYRAGEPVKDRDIIRLEHTLTKRNLHSHGGHPSPASGQQEVTCYGVADIGDGNDNWRVEIEGGGAWESGKRLRLIHVASDHALHSHQGFSHPEWTSGQQEVTCFPARDDNDWWSLLELQQQLFSDAAFAGQSVPGSMDPRQRFEVSITMRNTGTTTWTSSGPDYYALGSLNPLDNNIWGAGGRVGLPDNVVPGAEATFRFVITAPSRPGTYNFQWRMLQENVGWFGALSPNVRVKIRGKEDKEGKEDKDGKERKERAKERELPKRIDDAPRHGLVAEQLDHVGPEALLGQAFIPPAARPAVGGTASSTEPGEAAQQP